MHTDYISQAPPGTIHYFCHQFMCDYGGFCFPDQTYYFNYRALNIHILSLEFIKYFELKYRLKIKQLLSICDQSGIEVNLFPNNHKSRGYNFSYGSDVRILLKEDDSPSGQIHTLLHELYELIDGVLRSYSRCDDEPPSNILENNANKFSALVHAPDAAVLKWLSAHSLDVFGLKSYLRCSYATALIRMNEVLCNLVDTREVVPSPVIGILYERPYWECFPGGMIPDFQLNTYVKSRGFPFTLRRHEIDDLDFFSRETGPMTFTELRNYYSQYGTDLLLMNIKMLCKSSHMAVDILIRPVIWPKYEGIAKILIQLIPSQHETLRNLADRLNISQYDLD